MKIGIAGVGFMGTIHAAAWTETGAELAGFVAETREEAGPIAQQYGVPIYSSLDEMLPQVDVVDICTPTHLHAGQAIQSARAGRHVVCEKPLGRTVEQGQAMIRACAEAGVQLFAAHVVRYFPEYARAQAVVASGAIGKPGVVRLHRGSYRPKKPTGNWFLDEQKSGGLMLDLMIHDFDYARWIGGEVESVFAKKVSTDNPDAPGDYGIAILQHRSGVISHVSGAWAYPPPTFRTGLEIAGDGGLIEFDSDSSAPILDLMVKASSDSPDVGLPASPVSESPYTSEIKEFYGALATGSPVRVSPADGLAAVQIALAAVESARTGRAVKINPLPEVL